MAITFVGYASGSSGASATSQPATLTMPAVLDGDKGLLILTMNLNSQTPTVPTGWTQINTQSVSASYSDFYYTKTLTAAADSGTALSVTLNGATRWSLSVGVYRGATFDNATHTSSSTTTTTPAVPAVTPVAANCLIVNLMGARSTSGLSETLTAPAGYNSRGTVTSSNGANQNDGSGIWDLQLATGAGVASTATTATASPASPYSSHTISLAPMIAPAITSANNTSATINVAMTPFSVTTSGNPTVTAVTESGSLPAGVTWTDNGNGTATISGTPTASGSFVITITATNGFGSNATQSFTLTVGQAPAITSSSTYSATQNGAMTSFTVTTTGFPAPTLTKTGTIAGVTFTDNGNGTATIAGTPTSAGAQTFAITAHNATSPDATQTWTLTVSSSATAATFSSAASASFNEHASGTFTVTTTGGTPTPVMTKTGALPSGVTFTDNMNGTATIAGISAVGTKGSYPLTITATNTAGAPTQAFTLTIAYTYPGPETLFHALNRMAGTTGVDLDGAANIWAGTTGLALLGALNAKAGTTGLAILEVLNLLATGDKMHGYDVDEAAGGLH